MTTAHAKNRAPSAAKRWLSCPQSAFITPMYPNDASEASLKGDYWHSLMEDMLRFGAVPSSADPDAADAMEDLLDYVKERIKVMGGPKAVRVYIEERLDIPETGEFGTADIILVSDREIEIIDEKSGYIAVNVKMNPQLMVYLLGAIARFGERKNYTLTVHQPNFDHVDGPIRSFEPSEADIEWLRREINYSVSNPDECKAGKHCKETYCPHRGACEPFMYYVQKDLFLGWHPSEVKATTDDMLATALDAADELAGWRNELRSEAMRRIMNMDRNIQGYKVVKGRRQRAVINPLGLVRSVSDKMGDEWAMKLFPDLAPFVIHISVPAQADDATLKFLGTPKHIEDVMKLYSKASKLPRGGWQAIYNNVVGEFIRETASGLTLEKAIDGRPAHKRGSEFGNLNSGPATII